jgi:hypothetical protein
MAWKMSYTDQYDENYPNSYWVIAQCNSSPRYSETGMILFYGYPDEAHKGKRIIGQKQYSVSKDEYQALVQGTIPSPLPNGVSTPEDLLMYGIYQWAQAKKDVNIGTPENPQWVSFFENATMI